MELRWVREDTPVWDADKKRVIGGAPEGAFVIPFADGQELPGEWWSVRDGDPDSGAPFYVAQPATLVRRAAQPVDWRTALMQQAFMVLFFAVFVAITFAGAE